MVIILLLYCACAFTLILNFLAEEGIGGANNNKGDDEDEEMKTKMTTTTTTTKTRMTRITRWARFLLPAALVLRAALTMQDAPHQGLLYCQQQLQPPMLTSLRPILLALS